MPAEGRYPLRFQRSPTGDFGDYAMPDLVDKQTVDLARSEADAQRLQGNAKYKRR